MKIYYVRHGQTFHNRDGKWNGFVDSILTGGGVHQAYNLGHKTKDVKFDIAFTSPLLRTRQTAEIMLSTRPVKDRPPVYTDSRIIEYFCGDLEEHEWKFDRKFNDDFFGKRELYDYSTAETFASVEQRIKSFFDELRTNYQGKNVLVVAHGGVGRFVKTYFHGKPKSGLYSDVPELKNCELIVFE